MAEAPPAPDDPSISERRSVDAWLGGRLTLVQPRTGHRVGSDAVLVGAAAGTPEGRIVDAGAGVGAVGLAIATRSPSASVDLIEIDPDLARLAADNAARNGLASRARILQLDICAPDARRRAGLGDGIADCVVTNPPFFDARTVLASPDATRARAHVLPPGASGAPPLAEWIVACLALLSAGGRFVMIHRPEMLAQILAATERRLGARAVLPVHPRAGVSAHRLIVSGVKGSKAPLRVAPGLVLHRADGRLTAEADAIHRGEALIDWGA